ncbi:MAG: YHS domain-containing protein [Candidatus Eiseniibacteriota bacterium]
MVRDPVCSMHVEKNAPFVSEHKGNIYYLCSEGCKKSFDREPQKYIEIAKRFSDKYKEHSNNW